MASHLPTRNVLLVDDNDGDASLVRISAEDFHRVVFTHLPNAVQANRYLLQKSPFEDCPKPDLVLLDLRMPALDGSTVLQTMRESVDHRDTPVVVFTTSQSDQARCRKMGANEYIIKPREWSEWQSTIRTILRRYLSDNSQGTAVARES